MKKSLNRKGFTLIELLAALVILVAIMGIAIPSISSSLERTKEKQDQSRIKVIEAAAELYVTDHKNAIYNKLDEHSKDKCFILIGDLDLSEENLKDSNDNEFGGYVIFTRPNTYRYFKTIDNTIISCR